VKVACRPRLLTTRSRISVWHSRHFNCEGPRARSWHFVQFVAPLSCWWALASGPGEICAWAGAIHKTSTKKKKIAGNVRSANWPAQFDLFESDERIAAALIASCRKMKW
jgi:hypothetical protein